MFILTPWATSTNSGAARTIRTISIDYETTHQTYPQTVSYPHNLTEAYGYDARFGLPTVITDVNDLVTRYTYDGFGRLDLETGPNGPIDYVYDTSGPGLEITTSQQGGPGAGDDYVIVETYNGLGQLVQTTVPGGSNGGSLTTAYQYDGLGRLVRTSLPVSATGQPQPNPDDHLETTYDALGRPLNVETLDGASSYVYTNWNQVTVTDAASQAKSYSLDAFGRVIGVSEGATQTVYTYTLLGQLAQIKDTAGNVTGIDYDSLGRKISLTDPDMGLWRYSYDSYGQLATQVDARGVTTTLGYDDLGRPKRKEYDTTADEATAPTATVVFTYTQDLLTQMSDGSGQTAWSYEPGQRAAADRDQGHQRPSPAFRHRLPL